MSAVLELLLPPDIDALTQRFAAMLSHLLAAIAFAAWQYQNGFNVVVPQTRRELEMLTPAYLTLSFTMNSSALRFSSLAASATMQAIS